MTFHFDGPVSFRLAVQGSFVSGFGGQMTSLASLEVIGMPPSEARTSWRGGLSTFNLNTHLHQRDTQLISSLPSNYIVWLERTVQVMNGVPVLLEAEMDVSAAPPINGQSQALFGHTAQLELFMPEGMSFTSKSGDFLSAATTPVPEADTAVLLAFGLLALAGWPRRRAGTDQRILRGLTSIAPPRCPRKN